MQAGDGWLQPWRLPHEDIALFPPEDLINNGRTATGVRLRFSTDANSFVLKTEPMDGGGCFDLVVNDSFCETIKFCESDGEHEFSLAADGVKLVEIWLPNAVCRIKALMLPDGAELKRAEDIRPKWITYGSSITRCAAAQSPAFTWPGVVARAMNLNLTCLGFGGQCHADPMVARLIRDMDADFISVKLGINIYGRNSLNNRSFLPAVLGTIATIREGHPGIPFVVCSPVWSPERETTPNAVEATLEWMREQVETAINIFRTRGDDQLFYVDGLKLFDSSMATNLPDNLHPNAEGYKAMGENFIKEVFDDLGIVV